MFIIDFRNKNVSEYHFSVIGNANVDLVHLYSNFSQYASGTSIYLKVRSHDEDYVDKIAIASENVSVEDGALLCKWTMGKVSTQCKKLYLQLQFEKDDGEIIAQTGIVSLKLGDTIDVSQEIEPIYPDILKSLQNQIDTLKADSYAGVSMSYANDTLSMVFKNKDNETLTSVQVSIQTSTSFVSVSLNGKVITFTERSGNTHNVDLTSLFNAKVDKTNVANRVYVTDETGAGDEIPYSENAENNSMVKRDNDGFIYAKGIGLYNFDTQQYDYIYGGTDGGDFFVPSIKKFGIDLELILNGKITTPNNNYGLIMPDATSWNANKTIASEEYVLGAIANLKKAQLQEVDTTECVSGRNVKRLRREHRGL